MFEVGEANLKPYKWKEVDRESYFVYTRFETESKTQYDVDLKSTNYVDNDLNNLRALGIEFSAKLKGDEGSSAKIVVNKGEMYRVMSTIADIIKTYIFEPNYNKYEYTIGSCDLLKIFYRFTFYNYSDYLKIKIIKKNYIICSYFNHHENWNTNDKIKNYDNTKIDINHI